MGISKKLRYKEVDLEFPPYKRRFRSMMEKNLYVRATALKIQNDVLRSWNPFRGFWDNEEDKFWDTLDEEQTPTKKEDK